MYSSILERWTQADPAGYVDGMDRYEFVNDGPTRYVDPRGTQLVDPNYSNTAPPGTVISATGISVSYDTFKYKDLIDRFRLSIGAADTFCRGTKITISQELVYRQTVGKRNQLSSTIRTPIADGTTQVTELRIPQIHAIDETWDNRMNILIYEDLDATAQGKLTAAVGSTIAGSAFGWLSNAFSLIQNIVQGFSSSNINIYKPYWYHVKTSDTWVNDPNGTPSLNIYNEYDDTLEQ